MELCWTAGDYVTEEVLPCLQAGLALYFSVSTDTNTAECSTALAIDCNVDPAIKKYPICGKKPTSILSFRFERL